MYNDNQPKKTKKERAKKMAKNLAFELITTADERILAVDELLQP